MQLAFLLLDHLAPLDEARVQARLHEIAPGVSLGASDKGEAPLLFDLDEFTRLFLMPMNAPVPGGEADAAANHSIASFGTGWTLPSHSAQIVVTVQEEETQPAVARLTRFTQILAALIESIDQVVGVYWGDTGATHDPKFFRDVASESEMLPIVLWNGVSLARQDDRISVLSLGMKQLGLPNLLLGAPAHQGNEALAYFFDMLSYLAKLGEPIEEGQTIGRSAQERLVVRYEDSPRDPSERVWCIDLP